MLYYDNKPVNEETFDVKGKDLDLLYGHCNGCGKLVVGKEAIPYGGNAFIPCVVCSGCRTRRKSGIQ